MQLSIVIHSCSGADSSGKQREMRSGLGLPTRFLKMSVRSAVVKMVTAKPSAVTCALCISGRRMMVQMLKTAAGITAAYMNSMTAACQYRSSFNLSCCLTYIAMPAQDPAVHPGRLLARAR